MRPVKILLVDDKDFVRQSLRDLLAQQPDWEVFEAHNGWDAVYRAQEIRPDVVVMDIMMPELSGVAAAYELRRRIPPAKIILISSYYTPEEAAHLARLFGDGNFISKSEIGEELIPAIHRLLTRESQPV